MELVLENRHDEHLIPTSDRLHSLLDVHGYIGLLDATIDRMLLEQKESKEKPC